MAWFDLYWILTGGCSKRKKELVEWQTVKNWFWSICFFIERSVRIISVLCRFVVEMWEVQRCFVRLFSGPGTYRVPEIIPRPALPRHTDNRQQTPRATLDYVCKYSKQSVNSIRAKQLTSNQNFDLPGNYVLWSWTWKYAPYRPVSVWYNLNTQER